MLSSVTTLGLLLVGAAPVGEPVGANWRRYDVVDPITDAKRPILGTDGEGGALTLKCDKPGVGEVYVHLISKKYLGGDGVRSSLRKLTYRFDALPPVDDNWRYSRSSVLAIKGLGGDLNKFVQALSKAKKLVIRAITYDHETVDMVFNVDGADKAIQQVYAGCGDISPEISQSP